MVRHPRDQQQEQDGAALGLEKHREEAVFPNPQAEVTGTRWSDNGPYKETCSSRIWNHTGVTGMLLGMPPKAKKREVFSPSLCFLYASVAHWPNLQRC